MGAIEVTSTNTTDWSGIRMKVRRANSDTVWITGDFRWEVEHVRRLLMKAARRSRLRMIEIAEIVGLAETPLSEEEEYVTARNWPWLKLKAKTYPPLAASLSQKIWSISRWRWKHSIETSSAAGSLPTTALSKPSWPSPRTNIAGPGSGWSVIPRRVPAKCSLRLWVRSSHYERRAKRLRIGRSQEGGWRNEHNKRKTSHHSSPIAPAHNSDGPMALAEKGQATTTATKATNRFVVRRGARLG